MPKCLLIVDPVPTNRIRLAAVLEAAQYDVITVTAPSEFARRQHVQPDLVLLGLHQEHPVQLMQAIGKIGLASKTPVLCLDVEASPLRRLQALRAGARECMPRKLPDSLLLARVRGLLREGDAERECERRSMTAASFGFSEQPAPFESPSRVACVIGENAPANLPDLLAAAMPHQLSILGVKDALRDPNDGNDPHVYLIATGTDDEALETILPELRVRNHSRHAPVLVVHDAGRPTLAIRALNLGASDIAADTSSGDELAMRIDILLRQKRLRDTLRQTNEQSLRLAATDPLTGLYNRRYAEAYLADLLMREQEDGRGYVLMLVDLDHFKSINDTFGHGAGDQVLKQVANRLRDNLRAGDLVARYGGEEFLVVLPDASSGEGEFTAERLRRAVCRDPVVLENDKAIPVTASIGVGFALEDAVFQSGLKTGTFGAPGPAPALSFAHLLGAADAALYRAKNAGRNRVEFSAS